MAHPILPDTDQVITCGMLKGWDTQSCNRQEHLLGVWDPCFGHHSPLPTLHPLVGGRTYHVRLCTAALLYAQGMRRKP